MKSPTSRAFQTLIATLLLGTASFDAHAQASRTWVSGVGDDANPASRTAPAKTFSGAISKTAAGGEISVLDPGGYGSVTITKSLTIDGSAGYASILASGTNGIIINAGVNDVVTIRNLSIFGRGDGIDGIRIIRAAEVNIESCVISEFSEQGIDIRPESNCRVNIKNTFIRGCGAGAVVSSPGVDAIAFLTIEGCNMNASSVGFTANARTRAVIDSSQMVGNTAQGLLATTTTGGIDVHVNDCIITDNGTIGVNAVGALTVVRLSQCTIAFNNVGISRASGGQIFSVENRLRSNRVDDSAAGRGHGK
jgi:hypothetical protein